MKHILIIGGGFAGLNAAKVLGKVKEIKITLIDRGNYHSFQPLLYQVATAALSPADIASPIRSILSNNKNTTVLLEEVRDIDIHNETVYTEFGEHEYEYLILASGAQHSYFGHDEWEKYAPGLKTIEQANEIRSRILTAFESAEKEKEIHNQKSLLTFVIVGAGPTGVEMAGAIGELSRFSLAKDFKNIDPKHIRIVLIEAGSRILPSFSEKLSRRAAKDLEHLGVEVWTSGRVTQADAQGVKVGEERVQSSTVLWAAGVQASGLGHTLGVPLDSQGRVIVQSDLSVKKFPNLFVAGDLAHFPHQTGSPLPGLAPVALQQGRFIGKNILRDLKGQSRGTFQYIDKGQVATIGRSHAIVEIRGVRLGGFLAWLVWLFIHIYYLTGFRNRVFVMLNWAWSYLTFRKGARLIFKNEWRSYHTAQNSSDKSFP